MVMAIDDGDRSYPAFAGDDGAESAKSILDLPADVLALVLRRLDGASLAALGSACAAFRDLAADPAAWRALCLAHWPSLRDADTGHHHHHHPRLFGDAFPFPAVPVAALAKPPTPVGAASLCGSLQLPARLVSRRAARA